MSLFGKGNDLIVSSSRGRMRPRTDILFKWPDLTIRKFTQVTVQPDETALFIKEGKVAGTLPQGRSTLDGALIPFLGDIVDWASGGNMYRAELYFVGTREFVSLPFGGPIDNIEDPETGLAVGLRVFGEYALAVSDPATLILKLVGTRQASNDLDHRLGARADLEGFADRRGAQAHGGEVAGARNRRAHGGNRDRRCWPTFRRALTPYGVKITRLGNVTISLKPEDEQTLKGLRKDAAYTRLAGGFREYGVGAALKGIGEGRGGRRRRWHGGVWAWAWGSEASWPGWAWPRPGAGTSGGTPGRPGPAGDAGPSGAAGGVACRQLSCCRTLREPNSAPAAARAIAPPKALHCTQCGTAAAAGAKFCGNCGSRNRSMKRAVRAGRRSGSERAARGRRRICPRAAAAVIPVAAGVSRRVAVTRGTSSSAAAAADRWADLIALIIIGLIVCTVYKRYVGANTAAAGSPRAMGAGSSQAALTALGAAVGAAGDADGAAPRRHAARAGCGRPAARHRCHTRTGSGLRIGSFPAARGNDFLPGQARNAAKRRRRDPPLS